jgi:hypothetical protein
VGLGAASCNTPASLLGHPAGCCGQHFPLPFARSGCAAQSATTDTPWPLYCDALPRCCRCRCDVSLVAPPFAPPTVPQDPDFGGLRFTLRVENTRHRRGYADEVSLPFGGGQMGPLPGPLQLWGG